MKKSVKTLLIVVAACAVCGGAVAGMAWHYVMSPLVKTDAPSTIQLYPADDVSAVARKVKEAGCCDVRGFRWLTRRAELSGRYGKDDAFHPFRPGNYEIKPGDSMRSVWLRLASGAQAPIRLVVGCHRSLDRLAGQLASQLMTDSASLMNAFSSKSLIDSLGYTAETLPALFIPDTYEVYWTLTPEKFMARMKTEHDRFWTPDRLVQAETIGLTPNEVATLASIVSEETNKVDERPVVAGLYLNRLSRGIPLQACPTVKYAVGDPTLRRILYVHLATPSPYNTYLHQGLPPGPIRMVERSALEAVLQPAQHEYLYMCAKEDFSGYHNFAVTLAQHNANARRYQAALNARGIR